MKDTNAFTLRYGAVGRVAGAYSGNLDHAGERVVLTSLGQAVQDFSYSAAAIPPAPTPGRSRRTALVPASC